MATIARERERSGLAFDADLVTAEYERLAQVHGEDKAREILAEQLSVDLLTHVAELKRVGFFSYTYGVDDGVLVRDNSHGRTPIREMFTGLYDAASHLWREVMIPGLEQMPTGGSAFTLSAKADGGGLEGAYDYGYFFHKMRENRILCWGVELELTKPEQREIVNRQLYRQGKFSDLLAEDPPSEAIRSRAIFYQPGKFENLSQAFIRIIGDTLNELRGEYDLSDETAFSDFIVDEEAKLVGDKEWIDAEAIRLASQVSRGFTISSEVADIQMRILWQHNPELIREAMMRGAEGIDLPCGFVGFNLRFTAGDNLIEGVAEKMECVQCPFCHQTVDAIVTASKIKCPACGAEADR